MANLPDPFGFKGNPGCLPPLPKQFSKIFLLQITGLPSLFIFKHNSDTTFLILKVHLGTGQNG